MTAVPWQYLVDPVGHSGAVNMAMDQALLDEAGRSGTATLRLYRWDPPCLSLGRNEAPFDQPGCDVVRRPTGGRSVWHEHEVTYAVAAPIALFGKLRTAYVAIHERLAAALRSLGAHVTLAPDRRLAPLPDRPAACFDTCAGGEIVAGGGGRKLVGSAQRRQGSALLQHGSILLAGSQRMLGAAGGSTTLSDVLGRAVSFGEVADAIVAEFGNDRTWRR